MDIASLGIKIDTSDAAKAVTDLDKVVQSGEKAEKAAADISAGFDKASASASDLSASERKLSETLDEAKARLLATAKASLESSEYYQRLTTSVNTNASAMESSGSSASSLASLQRRLQAESDALVGSTDRQAEATKKAAAATGVQAEGLQELLGKINPVQKKLQELDDLQLQLTKHRKAGNIDDAGFKSYSADIEAARAKQKGFNDETVNTKTGLSALALNSKAARENVLQLGNALAEGNMRVAAHNILEIGTNAGASALRLAALAAPVIAVAAALGVLAYAHSQGSKEQEEYNKSLILTGNYAGTSAGQLADMARQVSATVGTTGAAATALASLAGTGKIAGGSFEEIAEAALSMEQATGKSVDATIAEFVKIAKDPVAAAKELNDQYHFLTASVYEQIVALKDQGNEIGATKLLTDTYAETVKTRSSEITQNLGYIERAWKGVKEGAAGALDATLGIGRQITLAQQAKALENKLANPSSYSSLPIMGEDNPNMMEVGNTREEDEKRLELLKSYMEIEKRQSAYLGDIRKSEEAAADGMDLIRRESLSAQSQVEKLQKKLVDLDKARQKNIDNNSYSPDLQKQYESATAGINKQIADAKKKAGGSAGAVDLTAFNDAQNSLKGIQAEYANTQKQLDAAQKAGLISQADYATQRAVLIKAEKEEVTSAYQAEIDALEAAKGKKSTSATQSIELDKKIADARADMVKAQKDADSQLNVLASSEEGRAKRQAASLKSYVDALNLQAEALQKSGQRAVLGVGRGDRENALSGELNAQDDRFAQASKELANQRSEASLRGASTADLDKEFGPRTDALAAQNKKATDQIRQNYADVENAQGDWTKGATAAWDNYLDSARNIAGQTKSLFGNAFSSMEDSLVNFAVTGKASFADFTKSILADMARIATRQASSALLGSLVGAAASYFGGSAAGGGNGLAAGSAGANSSNLGASAAGYSGTYFQADGGAWANGVQMFADGGAFTNSIVSKPTAFGMANGKTGIMGEAGEEAIMPLTRTSGGKLGVMAVGGGGGGGVSLSMNMPIVISDQEAGRPDGAEFDAEAFQRNMETRTRQVAVEEIAKSWRQGGVSRRNVKG
ncbi:phage tail protein [Pseudomonas sp. 2822-15]|uniref:phage tail tape measure protein n=1 Tax=Pseudomonas sp. 2822-15 TaxID=1712677 RepID=UPI000C15B134|nr:phage tail tape measure protein [Pseudomonas sp. 2822-15]PIB40684.1 phage tail protein [Pseudomonas sp. 2822-15]